MKSFTKAALISLACVVISSTRVSAEEDRSFRSEYERIQRLRQQIESSEIDGTYRQSDELRFRIVQLQRQLEDVVAEAQAGSQYTHQIDDLRSQINALERELAQNSKIIMNFREAAGNRASDRLFPGVSNRLAVFTFDDPHGTKLGDTISFLLSKKLLFSAPVSSFATANYQEGLDRAPSGTTPTDQTSYFDKVDAITKDQGFLLAVWGRISRTEKRIRIESFLQVPADANQEKYLRQIRLPEAMGGGSLTARLKSDRIPIQQLEIDFDDAEALQAAASQVAKLRTQPNAESPVSDRMEGGRYAIIGSDRDWVEVQLLNGHHGWTSVDRFCSKACKTLMSIAEFTNGIVALTAGLTQQTPSGLTKEAEAMSQQLAAVTSLPGDPGKAIEIAKTWIQSQRAASPGFENVLAVAKMQNELTRARASGAAFDKIRLSKTTVEQLIDPLVEASISDPSDGTIVRNLVPLFDYVGDTRRRNLAKEISSNLNRVQDQK